MLAASSVTRGSEPVSAVLLLTRFLRERERHRKLSSLPEVIESVLRVRGETSLAALRRSPTLEAQLSVSTPGKPILAYAHGELCAAGRVNS